ncbi:hypothetical protein C8J57DRAFT_1400010 [Mycena rebaudengoi]|nr:hypothetical protein C8J57DRAFT_1400010 [Mycena rebaudengoi]
MHTTPTVMTMGDSDIHGRSRSFSASWRSVAPRHLLTSNDLPLETEALFIRDIIAHQRVHISYLDEAIARLHAKLAELVQERDETKRRMRVNAAIVSPLRYLPAEVLEQIFCAALPSLSEASARRRFDTHQTPWSLARVCRWWRSVALALPSLWSTVVIDLAGGPEAYPVRLLEQQLRLSKSWPLNVHFRSTASLFPGSVLLDTLVNCSHRWELADLRLTHPSHLSTLSRIRGRLPLLRSLRIDATTLDKQIYGVFAEAPELHHLTISNPSQTVALPWTQLRSYTGTGDAVTLLRLLKHCSANLVECRLHPFACGAVTSSNPVRMLKLRRIHVQDGQILEQLILPALKEILLSQDCVDSVRSLCDRSTCRLERLFTFEGHTPGAVSRMLAEYSGIRELGMQISWEDAPTLGPLLRELSPSPFNDVPCLAPNLTAISFAGCIDTHPGPVFTEIIDMVECRWLVPPDGPCWRLEFLGLFIEDMATLVLQQHVRRAFSRLEIFRREGLRVHIVTGEHAQWSNGRVPGVCDRWLDPFLDG